MKTNPPLTIYHSGRVLGAFSKALALQSLASFERFEVVYSIHSAGQRLNFVIGSFAKYADWAEVKAAVLGHFKADYSRGNSWHLALAMNRIFATPVVGVYPVKGDQYLIAAFATDETQALLTVDGAKRIDQVGELLPKTKAGWMTARLTTEDILSVLDRMADADGSERENWNDPVSCEFASLSDQLAKILLTDEDVPRLTDTQ